MDNFDRTLGDLANLLIAIDEADQAVPAAGKPESALVLIEACLDQPLAMASSRMASTWRQLQVTGCLHFQAWFPG